MIKPFNCSYRNKNELQDDHLSRVRDMLIAPGLRPGQESKKKEGLTDVLFHLLEMMISLGDCDEEKSEARVFLVKKTLSQSTAGVVFIITPVLVIAESAAENKQSQPVVLQDVDDNRWHTFAGDPPRSPLTCSPARAPQGPQSRTRGGRHWLRENPEHTRARSGCPAFDDGVQAGSRGRPLQHAGCRGAPCSLPRSNSALQLHASKIQTKIRHFELADFAGQNSRSNNAKLCEFPDVSSGNVEICPRKFATFHPLLVWSFQQTRGEGRYERASVPAHGTGTATRCLLTHPPDDISIASALKEIYEDIYVSESVSGPPCWSVVYMGLYGL
jgi:hypothetical protein